MTAAIIGTNTGYLLLTFLPPIFWLLFYLREDRHPEPKRLLLLAFLGGMAAAGLAIVAEILVIGKNGLIALDDGAPQNAFVVFLVIGLIEEYVKYLPVKFMIEGRRDFDESVDAMIYMMTSALGFAALENTLFIFPLLHTDLSLGLEVTANRFLGANLLHALSSGIVGFFLARAWFHPHRRHFIFVGVVLAALLHALFNSLILMREALAQGTLYIILLLATMSVMVFIDFERLKRKNKQ
ncbi:MAG: PrsW family intramembrane metalloprotease [Patescibacteria group bacterium]